MQKYFPALYLGLITLLYLCLIAIASNTSPSSTVDKESAGSSEKAQETEVNKVAVHKEGSLLVADDGARPIWRVSQKK